MKIPSFGWFCAVALCLFACSALAQPAPVEEVPVPDDMQLFLLIGQSNMAGRGKVEAADEVTHPRIFVLTKKFNWVPAKDPLHFDKPAVAGVGLASQFARVLAEREPGVTIGLIPCAVGGTTLAKWTSDENPLSQRAIDRAIKAKKKGKIVGILWHQGESDAALPKGWAAYPDQFAEMIAKFRSTLDAENAPLIIGELGRWTPRMEAFNREVIPLLLQKVPHCALVTSEDLNHNGDQLHFDSASLRILGARYAEAYLKLQGK